MTFTSFLARRYFLSKKSSTAVNIISLIAVFGISVATFALVVVLSAFNGLQELVESLYNDFEPDLKIVPVQGKWISADAREFEDLHELAGVDLVMPVIEELTLVRYDKQQSPCTIKGVSIDFIENTGIKGKMVEGSADIFIAGAPAALVGSGLSSVLSVYVNNVYQGLKFYSPSLSSTTILNPEQAFFTKTITPAGVFMVNPDVDNKMIIVPIEFAQQLLHRENQFTAVEIKVADGMEEKVQKIISLKVGKNYLVKSRFELNELIYQTNQAEKVVTFFILTFILLIAAFNIISSLTMILLEKEKDISTLRVLGMNLKRIRRVFVMEGMMINLTGIAVGLTSGLVICLLQINYGLVSLEGGIVEYYPVKLMSSDFGIILITAILIGYLASYFPSRILVRNRSDQATSAGL